MNRLSRHRRAVLGRVSFALVLALLAVPALAKTPLVIAAALDRQVVAPLLQAFERAHPEIALDYRDRSTLEVDHYARQAEPAPDVVISSAMPWQMARVNEGLAQPLNSPEARAWPEWAQWRGEVFGFTFEPIVIAYRLDLAKHMMPPYTHADLQELLSTQQELKGRVTTYSPLSSGVGYTLFQQDARYSPRFWDLVAAMGAAAVNLEETTRDMLEGISEGRYWLGYNLLGSYAMVWAQTHPEVMVQVPKDYALVLMRMAFIHRDAPHPRAAKQFLNFLLGKPGAARPGWQDAAVQRPARDYRTLHRTAATRPGRRSPLPDPDQRLATGIRRSTTTRCLHRPLDA